MSTFRSIDEATTDEIVGHEVIDPHEQKIGIIGAVFADDAGRPEWATVKTGLLGGKPRFVPLRGAELSKTSVHIVYGKDTVDNAPHHEDHAGEMSVDQEQELERYYELN